MKIHALTALAFFLVSVNLYAQQMVAAKMANLQLFATTLEGYNITAESSGLMVEYKPGQVNGTLNFTTVTSKYPEVDSLLKMIVAESVSFSVDIPEGKFQFGNTMNEKFSAEGLINPEKEASGFMMDFDVSNQKTNYENTFQIVGRATLSLSRHFGIERPEILGDTVSFMFSQNVEVFNR